MIKNQSFLLGFNISLTSVHVKTKCCPLSMQALEIGFYCLGKFPLH